MDQINFDGPPLPCHKTIPPGGAMDDEAEEVSMCAGALIFMKNTIKSAQHPDYGDALDHVERDVENVFQWSKEFLDYHKDPDAWFNRVRSEVEERKARASK